MIQAIEQAANYLGRFNDALMRVCRYLIILIVGTLAVILICAVFWRYVLNSAVSWSEEGSKYLMVWLTFLGAPIALRHFAHINIDLLIKALPLRLQQVLHLLVSLIIVFTMAILLWKGIGFAQLGARQVASSFNFSMLYMYVAVPIGAGLTCLVAIEHSLRALVGIVYPERGLYEDLSLLAQEVR
jgi:TRAP-type C4-dicarboxylate transport system permease small subunit